MTCKQKLQNWIQGNEDVTSGYALDARRNKLACGHLGPHSPSTRKKEQDSSPWTAQIVLLCPIALAVKFSRTSRIDRSDVTGCGIDAQLSVGKRRRYKWMRLLYEGLWSLPLPALRPVAGVVVVARMSAAIPL